MVNDRKIDQKREELDALISQAERRLMVQVDPYIVSRRGVDFGEYFYNLRSQLTSKIFSEESLSNTEFTRGIDQNVQDIIRENYEEILQQAILNIRGDSIGEVKHYVGHSYNDMLGQIQGLMQNIRTIMSSRSTIQGADGARLLQEADKVIAQVSGEIAGHKINLENLWAQLKTMVKAQEAKKEEEDRKQQGEQANSASILASVEELIADTDKFIAAQESNLAGLKNQLREYVEKHQVQEVDKTVESRNSDSGQSNAFRLSDEDMKKFNEGVQEVMRTRSEGTPDAKPSIEEDLSK